MREGAGAATDLQGALKAAACEAVDARRDTLLHVAHEIHAHPELAFEEHRASALLVATLRDAGLAVEAPAYGLATAFESRSGASGPTVALLAEYDALPGIGHACGHNRGVASHASGMPERGVNALDALVTAYQAIAQLRQHIKPTERVHGIFTEAGQAPNVVPERAAGRFYVRSRDVAELAPLKRRIEGCFRAGAEATGCTVEIEWREPDYLELRTNWPLAECYQRNAESLGRTFFPYDKLPPSALGTTDMGNVSQRVPSIHPMIAAAPIHEAGQRG